jgi:D-glycero-alpha-D-manno-heptose-7-phosphate kinase
VRIDVSVPVRICDNGGWTDTWFGGPGRVLNIAVDPGVSVSIRDTDGPGPVVLDVRNPLTEAAVAMLPPPVPAVEIMIRSAVPAGCGAGTSAAVAVALLAGLSAARGESPSPRDVAYAAHSLEVDVLGIESGIQDQLSAAFGGISYIEIDVYPDATVERLPPWPGLDAGLTLVSLGRAHDSSSVHRQVIEHIAERGAARALDRLRAAAVAGRDAVVAQDLRAFGRAMVSNTDAQRSLYSELVGTDATRVIELAALEGAVGWKVNGAGGDGGSVTILHEAAAPKAQFADRVTRLDARYRVLPVRVATAGLECYAAG